MEGYFIMVETALYIVPNKARQEQISTTNC